MTGEHPCRSVVSTKMQSNFIEITLRHGCSPVNLLHIFKTLFSKNTSGLWMAASEGRIQGIPTFTLKKKKGRIDSSVSSTRYRSSSIPSGGLEIPLMMTFRSPRYITHQKMKDFMAKLYCYDHKSVTENVESDSDSDEFHIEIKENVMEEGENSKVVVAPKVKDNCIQ